MSEDRKTIVSSWNEWDPLKHVIVGRAEGTMVQAPEIAVQRAWPEYGFNLGDYGPYPEEMTAMAIEQMDNLPGSLKAAASASTAPRHSTSARRFPPPIGNRIPCSAVCLSLIHI